MIHILVDSYGCSTERLDNLKDVYEVINSVINVMQVDAIMPPQLIPYYYCEKPEDVGISAFVLLKGGHFTIHTFPQYGCYFADLLYDGYADAQLLETLLKREYPCGSFFLKRIDRDEFDGSDMGMYQSADFGPHYMIKAKLNKTPTIDDYMTTLDNLPYEVGMHPITRPCVLRDNIKNPTYLSGIAVIAESHIAMHYNYKTGEVLMDVFSCKTVDEDKYAEAIAGMFDSFSDVLILRGRQNEQRMDSQQNRHDSHKHWQDVIVK
ncbi:MAG: S-adenosylmethionine decarboxylase [Clostridia bacterium]|nr:S-adenosylmethionine decarboxylase [Clostridia bacterium]